LHFKKSIKKCSNDRNGYGTVLLITIKKFKGVYELCLLQIFQFFVTTKLLQSTTTFWRLSHISNPTQSFLCVCAVSSSMRISPDFPGTQTDFWSYICGVPQTTDRCCCAVPAPLPAAEAAAIS